MSITLDMCRMEIMKGWSLQKSREFPRLFQRHREAGSKDCTTFNTSADQGAEDIYLSTELGVKGLGKCKAQPTVLINIFWLGK